MAQQQQQQAGAAPDLAGLGYGRGLPAARTSRPGSGHLPLPRPYANHLGTGLPPGPLPGGYAQHPAAALGPRPGYARGPDPRSLAALAPKTGQMPIFNDQVLLLLR